MTGRGKRSRPLDQIESGVQRTGNFLDELDGTRLRSSPSDLDDLHKKSLIGSLPTHVCACTLCSTLEDGPPGRRHLFILYSFVTLLPVSDPTFAADRALPLTLNSKCAEF